MIKKDRDELVLILKDRIAELSREKETLMKQNFDLQNALMATRAPEAYRDMQRDLIPPDPKVLEEMEKQRTYASMLPKVLKTIESPLFDNVDDMVRALGGVISEKGIATQSLHENAES